MKTVNKICQILAIVFGVVSLALFFVKFATISMGSTTVEPVGAALAFGSKISVSGSKYDMARSGQILFCFWITVIGLALSAFSFKSKKLRIAAPVFGLIAGIYMLVLALGKPYNFIDVRPLPGVTAIEYTGFVILIAVALLVFSAFAIAYLLIDDHIEVMESKGKKNSIPKKIVLFFRDYKSEVKKIVWPGFKDVLKNTGIVLVMCVLAGIFVWLIDLGLGKLLELVLGI